MLLKIIHCSFGSQLGNLQYIIAPTSRPTYYPSYDCGQALEKKEQKQVEALLAEALILLSEPSDNLETFKKALKKMIPSDLNIVSDKGIEWGFKEQLLTTVKEMNSNNLIFTISSNPGQQQILQKGYLEVYGVSPYRHLNKWMHLYECNNSEMQIRFSEKKEREQIIIPKSETEEIQESLKNTVKEEQKVKDGILERTKNAIFRFNSLFAKEKKNETKSPSLKDLLRNTIKTKESHILVRDYEIETDCQINLMRKDTGQYLQGEEWVDNIKLQRNTFYLRTETLIDPKESVSLKLNKTIVLTDFNWMMKGNPWVWVYRFDLQQ